MQMGPSGMQQPPFMPPAQLMTMLMPVIDEAARMTETGAALPGILRDVVLASFMVGRGMSPNTAAELVRQWPPTGLMMVRPRLHPEVEQLMQSVMKNLQDEANATLFYRELSEQATDETIKDYILHAMKDEMKHFRELQALYRDITGHALEVTPEKTEFKDLRDGLKKAMGNEYEAYEEYRDLYLKYPEPAIRDLFFDLLTDEIEHVTRFNYALQTL